MFASASTTLARLSRWPRRIAALICLLLAAGTALVPPESGHAAAHGASGAVAGLRAGEVAAAVPVAQSGLDRLVRPGARVGVLAAPGDDFGAAPARDSPGGDAVLVADRLRVLAVNPVDADIGGTAASVVVAATRPQAVQLARYASAAMLLIVDGVP